MITRIKPFTRKKRSAIVADDVRANLRANMELVQMGLTCKPEQRKAYLVIAEALRRSGLCFDTADSRLYGMPDGWVLAVAPRKSASWTHSYLLDAECASHLAKPENRYLY
nr:MAG: hypothetical protein 1 [Guangxi cystovirus 12]